MAKIRIRPLHSLVPLSPFWEDEDWPFVQREQALDVYETDKEVIVKAPMPGIPEENINVTFEDGVLRISGKYEETEEEKKKKRVVYQAERMTTFDYTTTLPRAIEASKISAEVENGVLVVKAPLAPSATPKKIAVKKSKNK